MAIALAIANSGFKKWRFGFGNVSIRGSLVGLSSLISELCTVQFFKEREFTLSSGVTGYVFSFRKC